MSIPETEQATVQKIPKPFSYIFMPCSHSQNLLSASYVQIMKLFLEKPGRVKKESESEESEGCLPILNDAAYCGIHFFKFHCIDVGPT